MENMTIKKLDKDSLKKGVLEEWTQKGLSPSSCMEIEDALLDACHDWYAVTDNGDTLLVFEIRRAVNKFIKTLKLYYGPRFDSNFEKSGVDLDAIESMLGVVVQSFGVVFAMLINEAKDTIDRTFKIHSDHPMERMFFVEIAKILRKEYPNQYKAKFYGKWIEIEVC